jgi:hypothetical protein
LGVAPKHFPNSFSCNQAFAARTAGQVCTLAAEHYVSDIGNGVMQRFHEQEIRRIGKLRDECLTPRITTLPNDKPRELAS